MNSGSARSADDRSKIRVGLVLTGGVTRVQLDELCEALAGASGIEVEGVGLWYQQRLLAAMDVGDIDVAWLPSILAVQALAGGFAAPLALPLRGGTATYSAALFTREGSPIRDAADLDGARVAWVDRQSPSGYLLIRAHLRALGIDLARAFGAEQFVGSHEAVTRAVLDGAADVGASYLHLDQIRRPPAAAPHKKGPGARSSPTPPAGGSGEAAPKARRAAWGDAPVRVLAHTGPIPAGVIAANRRLDPALFARVQRALTESTSDALRAAVWSLLGSEGFIAPQPGHLDPLMRLLPSLDEHARGAPAIWPRDR